MVNFNSKMRNFTTHKLSNGASQILSFQLVEDPRVIIPVLERRLPISSMMYNQVIMYPKHLDDLQFYTLGNNEISPETWIVSNNTREDYGCHYNISAPTSIALGEQKIPEDVIEAFSSCDLIDWNNFGGNEMTFFVQSPKPISDMILDLSTQIKGMVAEVHPCVLFTMKRDHALKLEVSQSSPGVQLRRLEATKKDADIILSTWKYTLPGSEKVVLKCLERNASAGVFVEGNDGEEICVCGVYIPAMGLLSALYTLNEYRKRGYAKLTMKFAFREYARDGCIPCLTVELQNQRSIQFHESLGMDRAEVPVNFVIVKKLDID